MLEQAPNLLPVPAHARLLRRRFFPPPVRDRSGPEWCANHAIWRSGKFLALHNCRQTKLVLDYQFSVHSQQGRRRLFARTSGCGRRSKANPKAASIEQPVRRRANDWSKPAPELRSGRDETVRPRRMTMRQAGCLAAPTRPLPNIEARPYAVTRGQSRSALSRRVENKATKPRGAFADNREPQPRLATTSVALE